MGGSTSITPQQRNNHLVPLDQKCFPGQRYWKVFCISGKILLKSLVSFCSVRFHLHQRCHCFCIIPIKEQWMSFRIGIPVNPAQFQSPGVWTTPIKTLRNSIIPNLQIILFDFNAYLRKVRVSPIETQLPDLIFDQCSPINTLNRCRPVFSLLEFYSRCLQMRCLTL